MEDIKSPLYVKKQLERKPLSIGDEIVVQVVKDAVKTKEPVVSTKLSLAGKYCVLTTNNTSLSVSKKITGDNHLHMTELLHTYVGEQSKEHEFGIIIRTNALEALEEELKADLEETISRFLNLKNKSSHQCAFAVMEKSEEPYVLNMKSKAHMEELVSVLKEQIKKDSVTCTFMDVTKLGLVELTRKKTYKSLKELV